MEQAETAGAIMGVMLESNLVEGTLSHPLNPMLCGSSY